MKIYTAAILLFFTTSALAQPALTTEQLKPFEGYYRSTQNKDLVVQFQIEKDTLVAKPLWVKMTVHLLPKAELVFHSIENVESGPVDIVFYRDSTGRIAAMSLGNDVHWNRDKDYAAATKKEIELNPDQLKPYTGVYQLDQDPYRLLQLNVKNSRLVLKQIWDGREIPFVPETPLDFFCKDAPLFTLHFTEDNAGNVTQFLAFKRDTWVKAKKPDLSTAALSTATGKYQSKDDPDNQITITARDNTLVVRQGWDGKEIVLSALTDSYFYNEAQAYNLILYKEANGAVKNVNLLGTNDFVRIAP
jgi:adenylate kinase family enzyme